MGTAAGDGGVEDGVDERDLGVAPDESGCGRGGVRLPGRRDRGDRGPGVDRLVAAREPSSGPRGS